MLKPDEGTADLPAGRVRLCIDADKTITEVDEEHVHRVSALSPSPPTPHLFPPPLQEISLHLTAKSALAQSPGGSCEEDHHGTHCSAGGILLRGQVAALSLCSLYEDTLTDIVCQNWEFTFCFMNIANHAMEQVSLFTLAARELRAKFAASR